MRDNLLEPLLTDHRGLEIVAARGKARCRQLHKLLLHIDGGEADDQTLRDGVDQSV